MGLALSLEFYLSLSETLRILPRYLHYHKSKLILPSISTTIHSCSLRISSASLFAPYFQLLASLIAAVTLVRNLDLASSNYSSSFYLKALSYLSIIPHIFYLVPYNINPNHTPPLSLSSQNIASNFPLINWKPDGPFQNDNYSIS